MLTLQGTQGLDALDGVDGDAGQRVSQWMQKFSSCMMQLFIILFVFFFQGSTGPKGEQGIRADDGARVSELLCCYAVITSKLAKLAESLESLVSYAISSQFYSLRAKNLI